MPRKKTVSGAKAKLQVLAKQSKVTKSTVVAAARLVSKSKVKGKVAPHTRRNLTKRQKIEEEVAGEGVSFREQCVCRSATRSRSHSIDRDELEDGEVQMEVEGQETEYASENEEDESDSGSNADDSSQFDYDDVPDEDSQNNNTSMVPHMCHASAESSRSNRSDNVNKRAEDRKLDDKTMDKVACFMEKRGLVFAPKPNLVEESRGASVDMRSKGARRVSQGKNVSYDEIVQSPSEITIYQRAVGTTVSTTNVSALNKRDSSSSDEPIDTSDENMDVQPIAQLAVDNHVFALTQPEFGEPSEPPRVRSMQRAGSSRHEPHISEEDKRFEEQVRDAERSRARVYDVPGRH